MKTSGISPRNYSIGENAFRERSGDATFGFGRDCGVHGWRKIRHKRCALRADGFMSELQLGPIEIPESYHEEVC